jgi:hypothetical protein
MDLSSGDASIVVAVLSLVGVAVSLVWNSVQTQRLTALNDRLTREREAESKAEQAVKLVARYRDPLLEAAFDLQSRLYNALSKTNTFRWHGNDDYFLPSTLFLVGQFFGWVEILRRDMLYDDIANIGEAKALLTKIKGIQGLFSETTGSYLDRRRIYRVEQRAIGEIMIDDTSVGRDGIAFRTTIGYAKFKRSLDDPHFSSWFKSFESGLDTPPRSDEPDRLRAIQIALIDLIDFLDPDKERFAGSRTKLPGDRQSARS